jgi:hypothetical protein
MENVLPELPGYPRQKRGREGSSNR